LPLGPPIPIPPRPPVLGRTNSRAQRKLRPFI
jgi:hypothetical protein